MDLRRLKTIFIVVLAALNLALGIMIYRIEGQEKEIAAVTKNNVENLLQRDLIYFAPRLEVPESPDIYNVFIEKMSADNEEFAAKLLGGKYTIDENGVYHNDGRSLEIVNDEFVYKISSPTEGVSDFSPKGIETVCKKKMDELGIKSELYMFGGTNQIENGVRAIFTVQNGDDVFFDAYIYFDVSQQGIQSILGKNLISKLSASTKSEKYFNVSSVLLELSKAPGYDKNKKTTIMSIKSGYYIGRNTQSFRNVLAIPVWQIVTDSGEIFYYDARNGEYVED